MSESTLQKICDLVQEDVGNRGLRTDPHSNLITATAGDFQAACRSLAETADASVVIVTGFYIPHAQPPCGETDGPLGALFLARSLTAQGIRVRLATDDFCEQALRAGLVTSRLKRLLPVLRLPRHDRAALGELSAPIYWRTFSRTYGAITHLIALERVGPSHTQETLDKQLGPSDDAIRRTFAREVPVAQQDRCHTMRGLDITASTSPAHRLFEFQAGLDSTITTIGIGDGGNEIGMGKIPWDVIRRNIPNGGLVACRVPTDHLIVSGVSNWGAYGLAAGVALLRGKKLPAELFDVERERDLLRIMVERGPLVDGVTGQQTESVDGLPFERYAEPLRRIGELVAPATP
ncbi:MAG TPA: DUF4392 domain-containing protein [Gemmataceae bacterium]|nr:DUF4392 domain-containing protein [Gemmataceae bacterium]